MEDRAVCWACLYSCLREPHCTEAPCGSLITHRLTSAVAHDLDCSPHSEQTGWPTHATGLLAACLSALLMLHLCFGRTECPVDKWLKRFLKFSILSVFFFIKSFCMCVFCLPACLRIMARRGPQLFGNWSSRWLWIAMQLLRLEPKSAGRATVPFSAAPSLQPLEWLIILFKSPWGLWYLIIQV